ncbi:MAG: hypothetical protein HW406_2798 [Candidatus Brocadiaceae bacterium]|nr:hypothetical protein [Candidatus Brocadiaceae bacterium]
MTIAEIIKGHETAVISGSFVLLGVFLTLVVNSIQKFIDNRHTLRIKRLDLSINIEKTHLLEPVIEFIDRDLGAMQAVYALIFVDKKERSEVKIDNTHLSNLTAIEARIKGMGDKKLNDKFRDFTHKRIKIGNAIEHPGKDPYDELKQAIELAGDIMNSLFVRLKNLKN